MTKYRWVTKTLYLAILVVLLTGCNDGGEEENGTPTGPSPPSTPPVAAQALLRAANLSHDARTFHLAINGQIVFRDIDFPGVSPFTSLAAGEYRIQFLSTGWESPDLPETVLSLRAGDTLTVAVVGISLLETFVIRDDLSTTSGRARERLFNAVPDYPDGFDLAVRNGPQLHRHVGYLEASAYSELIPGIYDVDLKRAGTRETTARLNDTRFAHNATYTVFAVGTLRRRDIALFVARDSR